MALGECLVCLLTTHLGTSVDNKSVFFFFCMGASTMKLLKIENINVLIVEIVMKHQDVNYN